MRILILTGFNPERFKGGIETYILKLKKFLGRLFHVDILSVDSFGLNPYSFEDLYSFSLKVEHLLKEYDLTLVNSIYGSPFLEGETLLVIHHGCYIQLAQNVRNHVPNSFYLWVRKVMGLMENYALLRKRVVCVSQSLSEEVKHHFRNLPKSVHVIENYVETQKFKPINKKILRKIYSIPEEKPVGLYVGRPERAKGYEIFKKVVEATKDKIFWIQCLSGKGDLEPIENIKTFTRVPYEKMPEIYNLADFLFFPSLYEGFGYAPLEAMSCGIPALATETGAFKSVATKFPYLTLGDPKDLDFTIVFDRLNALLKILKNLEGNTFRNFIVKNYNIIRWERAWINLLQNLKLTGTGFIT